MNPEIERIRLRCVCGEDGCWVWTGAKTGPLPIVAHRKPDGARTNISARRYVYEIAKGKVGKAQVILPNCGQAMCLNPEHLKVRSRGFMNTLTSQRADAKAKKVLAAKVRWARDAKLSMEKARYVRGSDKTQRQLAAELGVSQHLISQVCRNVIWKETNPFGGLMR